MNVTPEMKKTEIIEAIKRHGKIDFLKMIQGKPKLIIVITFIAMLELIKDKTIRFRQSKQFSRIILTKRTDKDMNAAVKVFLRNFFIIISP